MAEIIETTDTQAGWGAGTLSGVVATTNGLELGPETEDFESTHGLTEGNMPVAISPAQSASGANSLAGSVSKAYSQRVSPEVCSRGQDFFYSGMVRIDSGWITTGLTGLCIGVPAGLGKLGYQIILDDRNGETTSAAMQIRVDYDSTRILGNNTSVSVAADTWYRLDITWSVAGVITAKLYNLAGTYLAEVSGVDQTYTAGKCGVCCYESAFWDDLKFPFCLASGQRIAPAIDISSLSAFGAGTVSWTATDNGQAVDVEVKLSLDAGGSWSSWQAVTSGGAVPGLNVDDLSNALLQVRQTLSTADTAVTPQLHSLTVYVSTATQILGVVAQEGVPVARTVRGYNRLTGALLAETTSSALDGSFTLDINTDGECYVVTLDDTADADDYNAQIADRIVPGSA